MKVSTSVVQPYQVIYHSYTQNRMRGGYLRYDHMINICPCLTERCDCLAVVVYEQKIDGNRQEI